jgi:hypothetical protein
MSRKSPSTVGAARPQLIRAFVDLADEGANGNPAREQHFGDVPTGPALLAAGR